MKRLTNNKHILHVLKKSNPKLRKAILKNSDKELIETVCEICHNILKGNVPITTKCRSKLKKYKRDIRSLASPNIKLASKRNIVVQKGGFLPIILEALLSSIIGSILNNATQ